jgi:hypothetical protein
LSVAHLYKITNKLTDEYYIGKHNGLDQKKSNGQLYWGSGDRIRNQVKKHGANNFTYEILVISTPEYIYELEEKMVTLNLIESDNKCLNLMGGGYGAKYTSEETKKKISLKNSGKIRSEEAKEKIRTARAKQVFTKEQRDRANKTLSSLIWMNDGEKSYRIRPENIQASKEKGMIEGRLKDYINTEYRNKFKTYAKEQWQKVKETGHIGHLIKVN